MIINKNRVGRKGQEEMVGFIMIIVIAVVIFLIILGVTLSKQSNETKTNSLEVSQFLGGMMRTTTRCALNFEPNYAEVEELMTECYANPNRICLNGKGVCEEMNETITPLLSESWDIGAEKKYKGYTLELKHEAADSASPAISIASLSEGNCTGRNTLGGEYISYNVNAILRLCY